MEQDAWKDLQPQPLLYWDENPEPNRLATIQADVISLIKECEQLKAKLNKREEEAKKEGKKFLLGLLEILDAFDRVFQNIEAKSDQIDRQTKIWVGNFKSVRRLVERSLKEAGVRRIEASDGKAIPGFHTIVEARLVTGLEDDTIIEEIENGYLWDGKILRKASVIVSKNQVL